MGRRPKLTSEGEQLSQVQARKFHAKRAEVKGWGLWGRVRENKHTLTSETAIKKIDAVVKFATKNYHDQLTDALNRSDSRMKRALSAEQALADATKRNEELSATSKELTAEIKKLKQVLEKAHVAMARAGVIRRQR